MMISGVQGYNNSKSTVMGESKKLQPGNYICKILGVSCEQNKSGNPMLVIQFDIAKGEYEDFYRESFEINRKSDPNATFRGVFRQNMTGNSLQYYKGVLTAIEKSNNIKIDGENGFDSSILRDKIFLGRFGEEEYLNKDGEIKTIIKLRFISSTENLDLPILDKKVLTQMPKQQDSSTFYSIENGVDEDNLPF